MSWSPTSIIFDGMETETFSTTVTYTPDPPTEQTDPVTTVTSYSVSAFSPEQQPVKIFVEILAFTQGVRFYTDDMEGWFPPDSLKYTSQANNRLSATYWDDLPKGARIYEYRPSSIQQLVFNVSVTAHLSTGSSESNTYFIYVKQNFSTGQQLLTQRLSEEL